MSYEYQARRCEDILERCLKFEVAIIRMIDKFPKTTTAFKIGGQIIDSGGSIGANLAEAKVARSKKEFISCVGISLREAEETKFWLEIIKRVGFININSVELMIKENIEIIKILVTIIKKSKANN